MFSFELGLSLPRRFAPRNDPIRVNDTLTGQAGVLENWKEKGKTLKFSVLELIWQISGSRIASKNVLNTYLKGVIYGRF